MSITSGSCSIQGASTPQSANIVEDDVDGDAQSVLQAGSYQPTPPGSKFWIPKATKKPVEGTEFDRIELALQFYKEYAREAGFEVRKGMQKNRKKTDKPSVKYFYCSREGIKPEKNNNQSKTERLKTDKSQSDKSHSDKSLSDKSQAGSTEAEAVPKVIQRRRRGSQRCGCRAQLRVRRNAENKYYVHTFFEKHNHSLVNENDYKYLRVARKLTFPKQQLIHQLSIANLGPTRSWKVLKEMYGGFEEIGFTDVESRNYKRELNEFIGGRDAHMAVDKLLSRQKYFSNFSMEYKQDKADKTLVGLFWADEQAKRNYDVFGDVVSFDATFRSNRYNMVLVPFTGIDNHNRCILFGVTLLASEAAKKYTWLLKRFKKIFGSAPKVVVTNQDPALKIAIEKIFPESRHRLCMWHIMHKLTKKVGSTLCKNTNFKQRLCDIVWTDKIDPDVFEEEWKSITSDFKLTENRWLTDMFGMPTKWIPAYFRHKPMSGLMRTTSRSESENHFLGQITNTHLSLVEFISHYDTALDSQRFIYGKNTYNSNYTTPDLITHLEVEKQAAALYTITLFYDVQDEIWSSLYHCCSLSVHEYDTYSTFMIRDTEADYKVNGSCIEVMYEVRYEPSNCSVQCSCLRYECYGLLCRHIFYVLRMCKVFHFPKQYLQTRWSKHAMCHIPVDRTKDSPASSKSANVVTNTLRQIYKSVDESITHFVADIEKLHIYRDDQAALLNKAKLDVPTPPNMNTPEVYAATLGVTIPPIVTIHPPHDITNKGQVSRTRHKSKSEIAMKLGQKPKRRCKTCLKYARHDSRNCPLKKKGLQDQDMDMDEDSDADMDQASE